MNPKEEVPRLAVIKQEQAELKMGLAANNQRVSDISKRLDRLYEVIVRREEHEKLAARLDRLELEVAELKRRVAA